MWNIVESGTPVEPVSSTDAGSEESVCRLVNALVSRPIFPVNNGRREVEIPHFHRVPDERALEFGNGNFTSLDPSQQGFDGI